MRITKRIDWEYYYDELSKYMGKNLLAPHELFQCVYHNVLTSTPKNGQGFRAALSSNTSGEILPKCE